MATTKKATTKKTASKAPAKKTTTRKVAATKAPTVSKTVKKSTAPRKKTTTKAAKSSKQGQMHSFRVARDQAAFTSFRITRQTVYWIILVAFIIFVQLWIVKLQVEVATLLDAQQTQLQNM